MACSATSAHFYLPPRYETPVLNVNVSLDMANLQAVNITALHFCIWQHMGRNHSETELQHLATLPSIHQYTRYINTFSITPYTLQHEAIRKYKYSMELVYPPGIHISALGSLIPVGIGLFCCNFFCCQLVDYVIFLGKMCTPCLPLGMGTTRLILDHDKPLKKWCPYHPVLMGLYIYIYIYIYPGPTQG